MNFYGFLYTCLKLRIPLKVLHTLYPFILITVQKRITNFYTSIHELRISI